MKKESNKVTETKKRDNYIAEKKNVKREKKHINVFDAISKYFNGVVKEAKRVRWTTGKELVKYSIASIMFVILFGLYFYGIDWIALLVRSLAK